MQRACQHCFAKERQGFPMKICSACKKAHYCSKECQVAAWAHHKPVCAMNKEGKSAAIEAFGKDTDGDYKKWLRNARPVLTLLVHKLLQGRYDTHLVHLEARYQPEERVRFKIELCAAMSVAELRELNAMAADSVEQHRSSIAERLSGSNKDSVTSFAMIVCNDGGEAGMMQLVPLGVSLDGSSSDNLWQQQQVLGPGDLKLYVDALNAGRTVL